MNPVAAERVLKGVAATLGVTLLDYSGEPVAAGGTVTVDLTRGDGTTLVTGGSTGAGTGIGAYTYALAAGSNTLLDLITAVWKDAGTERLRTLVDVVGGFYFTSVDLEEFDASIDTSSPAKLRRLRSQVERECERITGAAWVPRYVRKRYDGNNKTSLLVDEWAPRSLRSVRVYSDETTYESFTAAELAAVELKERGELIRRDGGLWTAGEQNIVIELEHGYDRPPEDLQQAAMARFRWRQNQRVAPPGLETAIAWTTPDGARYELPDADVDISQAEVFRVYVQHSKRIPAVA